MSYESEYAKLRKKRLEEEEKKKSSSKTSTKKNTEAKAKAKADKASKNTKTSSSYEEEYAKLRQERLASPETQKHDWWAERFKEDSMKTGEMPIRTKFSAEDAEKAHRRYVESVRKDGESYEDADKRVKAELSHKWDLDDGGRTWFTEGTMRDGYQFGDVTKGLTATALDAGTNATAGILDMVEGIYDSAAYGVLKTTLEPGAQFASWIEQFLDPDKEKHETWGYKKEQQARTNIGNFIAADTLNGKAVAEYITPQKAYELIPGFDVEKDSVLGDKSDSLAQSAGQVIGQAVANYFVPGIGIAMMAASSFGGEVEGALNSGATLEEAGLSGLVTAGAEVATEYIGGIKYGGKTLTDAASKALSRKISSSVVNTCAKIGMDMAAEGIEEVISGHVSAVGQHLTYMDEKEVGELFSNEDAWESFIGGVVLGGASGGVDIVQSKKAGVDYVTGLTKNEQAVVDKVVNDRIAEEEAKAEAKGEKLTGKRKKEIFDETLKKMERGYIGTDVIESVLGGDSYNSYQSMVEQENTLKADEEKLTKEIDTILDKENPTIRDNRRLAEAEKELADVQEKLGTLDTKTAKSNLFSEVDKLTANDPKLRESYNEIQRASEDFVADFEKFKGTKHEDAAKKTIENAIKAGANNTNAVHDIVDFATHVSAETGKVVYFKDGEQITSDFIERKTKEIAKLEAVENRTDAENEKIARLKDLVAKVQSGEVVVNGTYDSNGIVLNLDSKKPLNRIVGHEITHAVAKAKNYDKLRDSLFDFAKSKGIDIDAELAMKELEYEGVEGTTAEAELVADLVGDYLFTDSDFVNSLTTSDRNLAQRVYDTIKHLYKMATAGSKEARQLEKVKYAFEEAFRQSAEKNTADSGGKYSIKQTSKMPYGAQLELIEKRKMNGSNSLYAGKPSDQLQSAGFSDAPFAMNQGDYRKSRRESAKNENYSSHAVPYDFFEKMPEHLADAPMLIDNGKKVTVITSYEMKDTKGNDSYVIAGTLRNHEMESDTVNLVKSVYPLDDFIERITTAAEEGRFVVINKNKAEQMLATIGIQPSEVSRIIDLAKGTLSQYQSDVNTQFSLSKAVEETKDLVALHNLTADKLTKSLELGGLPMPSLAITKADIPHTNFGDITLVFGKETIDPKANKKNKVYSADAWTPTFPNVEYEADNKVVKRVSQKLDSLSGLVDEYFQNDLLRIGYSIEDYLNRQGGEEGLIQYVMDNYGLKAAYLEDTGKHIEKVTKQEEVPRNFNPESADKYEKVMEILGVNTVEEIWDVNLKEARDNHGAELEAVYPGITQSGLRMGKVIGMVGSYLKGKDSPIEYKTVTDSTATKKAVDDALDAEGFEAWVRNLFSGVVKDSGIYNNKDLFTPSGNRRSFKQTHLPVTLENIVKAMASQNDGNAKNVSSFNGIKTLRASTAETFKSIDEMHKRKDRLQHLTQEQADEITDALQSRLFKVIESIDTENNQTGDRNSFIRYDQIGETIAEIGESGKYGVADIQDVFGQRGRTVSDDTALEVKQLLYDVTQMPVNIYEAKPQRVVSFDEAKVFVIPYNSDAKLKQELLSRGYSIAEYDPNVEGDRQRIVNQFEEYKFSLSTSDNDIAPIGKFDFYGKDFRKKASDDVAPVIEEAPIAPVAEDIAPVAEDIAPVVNNTEETATEEAPFPDEIAPMTEEEANALQSEKVKADANNQKRTTRAVLHSQIVNNIKSVFASKGLDFDNVLKNAHRMNVLSINDNTPQRVNDKTFGYEAGEVLNDLTFNKVALNETEGVKWLNEQVKTIRELSKKYHIKPGSKESSAAQMYAEGFYVNEQNEIVNYGDAELAQDFPDANVQKRIKALANDKTVRQIYDATLTAINESRKRNAYPEIPRLDNYFLHFRAMNDTFSQLGIPFNPNDIKAKDLPTDINGTTVDRKPGQPFFTSALHREGKRTSFDLLGGIEKYLNGAKNQIYHIDDIQTARALWGHIAETYGQAHGLENLDAMELEAQAEHIQKVYDGHLSNYARFLNEYANNLAGKTALIDRGVEGLIGRRALQFINTVNTQTGRNQVGYSVSSPLTNFIPSMETIAKTSKRDSIKAFAQTISNIFHKDGFVENDPTLIRRRGVDKFNKTLWEKMSDPGYILMGAVDNITSEFIVRTKYNELTRKGMDSQQAHIKAGEWAMRIMGDRSLGQMPMVYNSKVMGLITKYQLEVRNQLDSQFYDTIQEAKVSNKDIENAMARNAKTAAKIVSKTVQIAILNHIFGQAFEKIAGYNPAFDIVSTIATLFGWDDDEDDEDTFGDNAEQAFQELLGDLPYTSLFTDGGRIPMSSALPIKELVNGTDKYGNEKSRWETVAEAAPYYILPGGYGQMKKTYAGLSMFDDDLPVSGSYTDSGNLRFPVEKNLGNVAQAALFGQYASENARDYFDNNRSALKEKQIQEYIDVDIPIRDYWEYREGLADQETLEDKFDYIAGLDLPVAKKNILINNIVDRKEPVDMEGYEDFSTYEEFDFSIKNPEKYEFFQNNGISYETYTISEKSKKALNWAYENQEKYTMSKAITDNFFDYWDIKEDLDDIDAKNEAGETVSGLKKQRVMEYINKLDIDYGAKLILHRSMYNSKEDRANYNMAIVEYLDSREDISYDDMITILKELDFNVEADGAIWWE